MSEPALELEKEVDLSTVAEPQKPEEPQQDEKIKESREEISQENNVDAEKSIMKNGKHVRLYYLVFIRE